MNRLFYRICIRSLLADLPLGKTEDMPAAAAVGVEQQEAVGEQIATTEQSTVNQIEEVAEEVAMAVEMAVA